MIELTRMDGKAIILNADWIQSIESTPDTLITLTTGVKLIVKDSVPDVVKAFKRYKREIGSLHLIKGEAA